MASLNLDAGELMSEVTMSFTLTRTYRIRMWVAARLIALAGLALGTTMVIVEVDGDEADQAGT